MADVDPAVPVYPIGVVEKLTGLSGRQIRYYEKTGLVIPARTKGNQRLYSPLDVDKLLRVKTLLAEGLNVEGVRAMLRKSDQEPARGIARSYDQAAAAASGGVGGMVAAGATGPSGLAKPGNMAGPAGTAGAAGAAAGIAVATGVGGTTSAGAVQTTGIGTGTGADTAPRCLSSELAVYGTGQLAEVPSREALAAGRKLSSLYPVTNQAELLRILQESERSGKKGPAREGKTGSW